MSIKSKVSKTGKKPNIKSKLHKDVGLNGKSSGMSSAEVAKIHGVNYKDFLVELKRGTTHELEHTTDKEVARRIALDHLYEDPKYYEKIELIGLKDGGKTNTNTMAQQGTKIGEMVDISQYELKSYTYNNLDEAKTHADEIREEGDESIVTQDGDMYRVYWKNPRDKELQKRVYAKGGYSGKTPEQVWKGWDEKERYHFLYDHSDEIKNPTEEKIFDYVEMFYRDLPEFVQQSIKGHISMGQYKDGGGIKDVSTPEEFKEWATERNIELIDELRGFRVGDKVKYTNEFGVSFEPLTIIGIDRDKGFYNRRFYLNKDSYWFPVRKEEIESISGSMAKGGDIDFETSIKEKGFNSIDDFNELVSNIDLSTPDKIQKFKKWQKVDGTKDGLLKLSTASSMANGGVTKDQMEMQKKIDTIKKSLASKTTSESSKEGMRRKISELEKDLKEMKESQRMDSIASKSKRMREKRMPVKTKEKFRGEYYIDISNSINWNTFKKKVWNSKIKYKSKTLGDTVKLIVKDKKGY